MTMLKKIKHFVDTYELNTKQRVAKYVLDNSQQIYDLIAIAAVQFVNDLKPGDNVRELLDEHRSHIIAEYRPNWDVLPNISKLEDWFNLDEFHQALSDHLDDLFVSKLSQISECFEI
ncbi:hypothetical protein LU293_00105 [Moraxella nasovis]|uniref:hypothetical protein n=1 Tax=Moraxella nasovis TaxID=2904121 RepID=UPI001F6228C9|nr:hypothetical protein [Moraxella nasovis]UNU73355.1 hypothetical protein LU293_00105 [Moraxella nasovis]